MTFSSSGSRPSHVASLAYMEALESERTDCQRALIAAALEEVLALRRELSLRQYG